MSKHGFIKPQIWARIVLPGTDMTFFIDGPADIKILKALVKRIEQELARRKRADAEALKLLESLRTPEVQS